MTRISDSSLSRAEAIFAAMSASWNVERPERVEPRRPNDRFPATLPESDRGRASLYYHVHARGLLAKFRAARATCYHADVVRDNRRTKLGVQGPGVTH